MRIDGIDGQSIEIELSERGPDDTPGQDDLLLNVTVDLGGYSATEQSWVVFDDWQSFMQQMRQLEERRRGQAMLVGASPRELEVTFRVTDLAGHMTVAGWVGREGARGFVRRLEFGFEFDPGLLGDVARELKRLEHD